MNKKIVVQKYGGSSVADETKIRAVAESIAKIVDKGKLVVVVVSAMGETTDQLIRLASNIYGGSPPKDELDKLLITGEKQSAPLLAMAIRSFGVNKAVSLTGEQIRLIADQRGRIKTVQNIKLIKDLLEETKVVVVAGFQGILDEKTLNPVTLDRGGSDTVAVALAAKLGVKVCQIFTDVDGVYTIDPRVVPEAKRFNRIDYRKMIDLSTAGAGVLKDRSVALADVFGVEIEVLLSPSLGKTTGSTKVCSGCTLEEMENTWFQPGVAIQKGRQVKVAGVPNKPGRAHTITSAISDLNIEDVNQPPALGPTDITFVFAPEVVNTALTALNKVKDLGVVGDIEILDFGDVYRLTLIDPLMKDQIGVLNRVTGAMAEAEVSIEMLSSSGTAIMVAIKQEKEILERAARALASKFNLIS